MVSVGANRREAGGGVETGRRLNTFATAARSLSRPSIPKPAQFNNSYSGQRCLRASGLRSAPRAAAEQTLSPTSGRSSGPPTGRRTLAQVHKAAAFRGAEAEAEGGGRRRRRWQQSARLQVQAGPLFGRPREPKDWARRERARARRCSGRRAECAIAPMALGRTLRNWTHRAADWNKTRLKRSRQVQL